MKPFNRVESLQRTRASKQRLEKCEAEAKLMMRKLKKEGKIDEEEAYKQIRDEILELVNELHEYISDLESDIIKEEGLKEGE